MMLRAVVVAAVVSLAVAVINPPLRIGAWNIKQFGVATMAKDGVPEIIAQVILSYDLMVIQEVQEPETNTAINRLLQLLNSVSQDAYQLSVSEQRYSESRRLERYAVFYRHMRISVMQDITYTNTRTRYFTYPPYMLILKVNDCNNPLIFGMIVLHTSPSLADQEMNTLSDVSRDFQKKNGLQGVIIGGDLNAAPNKGDRLRGPAFDWKIADTINTSIYGFSRFNDIKSHDRMIVLGTALQPRIYSGKPYCYDTAPGFQWPNPYQPPGGSSCVPRYDPFRLVTHVSDHYPVEVWMR